MNIVLLGHRDYASLYSLDRIIRLAPGHDYSVFLSGELKNSSDTPSALQDLAVYDSDLTDEFLVRSDTSPLLATCPDLPAPNSDEGQDTLRSLNPDLLVSIRYRRILKDAAIAIPRLGVLNLHSGILPDYKGVMATFWAMLADEEEIGTTLHRIVDAGIDTGPVIEINRRLCQPDVSYMDNLLSLYDAGCYAMIDAIELLADGIEPGQVNRADGGQYFSTPSAADIDRFLAKGLALF